MPGNEGNVGFLVGFFVGNLGYPTRDSPLKSVD